MGTRCTDEPVWMWVETPGQWLSLKTGEWDTLREEAQETDDEEGGIP